jgi:hypothetical protein
MRRFRHNPAASVDAPIALLASSWRFRRRATEQQRSTARISREGCIAGLSDIGVDREST